MTQKPTTADRLAARRQAIIAVAGKLLLENRLASATTLDIAKAAGISKRDLYAAFPSKDALIATMIAERVDAFAAPITLEPAKTRAEFDERLEKFSLGFLTFLLGPRAMPIYRLAIADALAPRTDNVEPIGRLLAREGLQRTSDVVRTFFAAAEKTGIVTFINREAALGAYFGALIGGLQMRLLLDPEASVTDAEIAQHTRLALLTLRGLEAL
ncbi:MAG: hypothetical protein RL291_771, partial [Pseudomonadota bacterium]